MSEYIGNKNNETEYKIEYTGNVEIKKWYKNGELHREDGPAIITGNGAQHWYQNGELHREGGPALVCPYGSQYWYKRGLKHREDGPAVITDAYEEWYKHGLKHREDGPAFKHYNNTNIEYWYFNNVLHREDGPAIIQGDYKCWYRYNKLHRIDGPAVTSINNNHYYLFGTLYNKNKYTSLLKIMNKFIKNLKLRYRKKINLTIYNNTNICKDLCHLVSEYII
jgi:hypothetical protein